MLKKGQIISCEVTGIASYGIFIKYENYVGLIHISELSDRYVKNIYEFAGIGDIVSAYILKIDEKGKKLTLSYKKCESRKRIYVAEMSIAFESLKTRLQGWIDTAMEEIEHA